MRCLYADSPLVHQFAAHSTACAAPRPHSTSSRHSLPVDSWLPPGPAGGRHHSAAPLESSLGLLDFCGRSFKPRLRARSHPQAQTWLVRVESSPDAPALLSGAPNYPWSVEQIHHGLVGGPNRDASKDLVFHRSLSSMVPFDLGHPANKSHTSTIRPEAGLVSQSCDWSAVLLPRLPERLGTGIWHTRLVCSNCLPQLRAGRFLSRPCFCAGDIGSVSRSQNPCVFRVRGARTDSAEADAQSAGAVGLGPSRAAPIDVMKRNGCLTAQLMLRWSDAARFRLSTQKMSGHHSAGFRQYPRALSRCLGRLEMELTSHLKTILQWTLDC